MLQSSLWDQAEVRLQLNSHFDSHSLSLSCLISLFLGKLKRAPQSFAQQSVSGSAFRESTQDCFLCLLSASWLYGSQEKKKKKIMEQGQNGRKEQSQGILLSRHFSAPYPFSKWKDHYSKEKACMEGGCGRESTQTGGWPPPRILEALSLS